ncbi:MAG TPA: protein-L-isoaspartate(D-aspartate) O-methyltransferase [Candidatus Polarisedimenticolaceae bacterium]|nr:protein-L-isoaspartate(D-aspartate) O-methyltransferase [Candidatus Polarisedimenticolaceae bacterium]
MDDDRREERERMVEAQIAARGVQDPAVLEAMRTVPRHLFVPETEQLIAYSDGPVAIGLGQTISQPFVVALMTALARPHAGSRILEVGTGCGYQAAILDACGASVWSIELEPELSSRAAETLASLGMTNARLRVGDGSAGWPEEAPFEAIVVTAAPRAIPEALLDQLAIEGRLVIPVGGATQDLLVVTRRTDGFHRESVLPVRFVPLR